MDVEKQKANEIRMVVTDSDPAIKKVEMVDGGTGGLKVSYVVRRTRNGVISRLTRPNEIDERPVQKEIRAYFDSLKEHLLRCCAYYWSNENVLDMMKNNVEVTYILVTPDDKFQIGGKNKFKNFTMALNSPLIDSSEYDEYDELTKIVNKVHTEAKLFMSGVKGADNRLLTIEYMKVKKEMADAEKSYDEMSEEEREIMMKEAFGFYELETVDENGKTVIGVKDDLEKDKKEIFSESIAAVRLQKNGIKESLQVGSPPTYKEVFIPSDKGSISAAKKKVEIKREEEQPLFIEDDMNEVPNFDSDEPNFEVEEKPVKKAKK